MTTSGRPFKRLDSTFQILQLDNPHAGFQNALGRAHLRRCRRVWIVKNLLKCRYRFPAHSLNLREGDLNYLAPRITVGSPEVFVVPQPSPECGIANASDLCGFFNGLGTK